ncbi:MAG: MiaB/RimO family radical SAM methylthiotransferase [Chloroflexota bacterium]
MSRYYLWTIGCQMNQAESERLAGFLEEQGYVVTASAEAADLILLNSCVVRQSAEDRVINKLMALRSVKKVNPEAKIALTGCLVDANTEELQRRFPHVDYYMKPGDTPYWLEVDQSTPSFPRNPGVTTFVPISYGCNNFCTYCIVPYRRGRERSRPVPEIKREVTELVHRGVKEVTLLGQNVDSYGCDLEGKPDLADLLTELNNTDGLVRIRFLTNHPKDMSQKLVAAVARLDAVCRVISLPVQSGSNEILKAMRRGYTAAYYRDLISRIRGQIPEAALSTDVIVGFPGESEADFGETVSLLAEIRFDTVHIAAYSTRPGTAAARELDDNVPVDLKKARLDTIERLQEKIAGEINNRLMDKVVAVLVEGRKKGKWYGRTESDKLVFFPGDGDYTGRIMNIRISHISPWSLQGVIDEDCREKLRGRNCQKVEF